MKTRIQKWGNSLAVRIPKAFAEELALEADGTVNIHIEGEHLIIERMKETEYTLEELLSQVDEHNLHGETDTGTAVGKEAW